MKILFAASAVLALTPMAQAQSFAVGTARAERGHAATGSAPPGSILR